MTLRGVALAAALTGLTLTLQPATAQTDAPGQPSAVPTISTPTSSNPPPGASQVVPSATGTTSASIPAASTPASITRQLTVDALEDMELVASGSTEEIGDIEGVVESTADKKHFVLIERGGFLGFGAKQVAIPLENLAAENDRLVVRNMDVAQLDALPEFENANDAFRELDDAQQVTLPTQQ